MSINSRPGNVNNYPPEVHRIENGDPTKGPTWDLPVSELTDRTAYIADKYDRIYVYRPASTTVSQTFALDLSVDANVAAVEFTLVGGGQSGARASAIAQGRGGAAGCVRTVYLPILTENQAPWPEKSFLITVGGGGIHTDADPDASDGSNGHRGKASYVQSASTGEIFIFAQGGGVRYDRNNYPSFAGTPYRPPYGVVNPDGSMLNALSDPSFVAYDEAGIASGGGTGLWTGFALRGGYPGGVAKTMGVGANGGSPGRGAGAGGGGGVLSSLSNGTEHFTGGQGGYSLYPNSGAQIGAQSATQATAHGGQGACGIAVVRVLRRPV